jgi:hypothetical protein
LLTSIILPRLHSVLQNFNMPAMEPRSNPLARNLGLSVLQTTAVAFAANKAGANKKDLMTAMGACWGASAVNSAWNAHKGHQKEKEGFANAAVQATLAGVLLYRGLRK